MASEPREGDGETAVITELEHTADIALGVTAQSLPDLFAGAALGMARATVGPDLPEGGEERTIELEDVDRESLLVNWLNNLLALDDTEGFVPTRVTVRITSEAGLTARMRGARGLPHTRHIKAATFHLLAVERDASGWRATVVFDV